MINRTVQFPRNTFFVLIRKLQKFKEKDGQSKNYSFLCCGLMDH